MVCLAGITMNLRDLRRRRSRVFAGTQSDADSAVEGVSGHDEAVYVREPRAVERSSARQFVIGDLQVYNAVAIRAADFIAIRYTANNEIGSSSFICMGIFHRVAGDGDVPGQTVIRIGEADALETISFCDLEGIVFNRQTIDSALHIDRAPCLRVLRDIKRAVLDRDILQSSAVDIEPYYHFLQ